VKIEVVYRLLQLLTRQRVSDIDLVGKASIIDALQKIGFSAIQGADQYAYQVCFSASGIDLTNLKRLIDLGNA
jgi:hypothetical protein